MTIVAAILLSIFANFLYDTARKSAPRIRQHYGKVCSWPASMYRRYESC